MLQNLLSSGNQKQFLGVSLTPGVGLEAVLYDKTKNQVINYGKKKVDYNLSTREIQDYTLFKTALAELTDEMGVLPKTMAFMAMPNVYSDFKIVPSDLTDVEIQSIILSQAEDFYVFKRDEPISGWCEVINPDADGSKKLAFTSFQKDVVTQLKDLFTEVGLHLVGVESSYASTLRGMYVTGLMSDVVSHQAPWTLMLINASSYNLFQMDGQNLLEWAEVPIAIKSFSTEEAYQAIASSASQYLETASTQKVYIVSQTDAISAKLLKQAIDIDKQIVAIDTNRFSDSNDLFVGIGGVVDLNEVRSVTLGCIGAASFRSDFPLILNVLQNDPEASIGVYFTKHFLGMEIDITQELIMKLCMFLAAVLIAAATCICGTLHFLDKKLQNTLTSVSSEISTLDEQINVESQYVPKEEVDMNAIIDEVAKMNVMANNFYDSIATDIPKNIWLTRYYNKVGDKLAVQGIAQNIVDIYEYYKNLRVVAPQSNIKLTELKVVTPDENGKFINDLAINKDTDRLYSFEIANIDINFAQDAANQQNQQPVVSEDEIIVKPKKAINVSPPPAENLEQPSDQMTPTK